MELQHDVVDELQYEPVNSIRVKPTATASEVKVKIENALRRAAELDAQQIVGEVVKHKVSLYGMGAPTWAERSAVERAAWSAPGVRRVEDDVHVAASSESLPLLHLINCVCMLSAVQSSYPH